MDGPAGRASFLKGLVVGLIPSLLIALLTMRKQPPRGRR
jgi:hypothetical protein